MSSLEEMNENKMNEARAHVQRETRGCGQGCSCRYSLSCGS